VKIGDEELREELFESAGTLVRYLRGKMECQRHAG